MLTAVGSSGWAEERRRQRRKKLRNALVFALACALICLAVAALGYAAAEVALALSEGS